MKDNIKVTVIVPVYKVSAYIERCIKSVMNQTYTSIDCIVVDDASPDDSIAKCEQLIAEYDGAIRFQILHHAHNRGLSAARNTGTDAATGDYIFYLDSDDELPSDSIEKLIRPVLNDTSIEMVLGNHARILNLQYQLQEKIKKEQDLTTLVKVRDFVFAGRGYYVRAWGRLIKRDFVLQHQLYFKEGLLYEDNLWSFFVLKHLSHLHVIPDVVYLYYRRSDSIVARTKGKDTARHYGMNYNTIADNLTEGERGREAKFYMRGFCYMCISHLDYHEFRRIAQKFMKPLWEERYLKDLFLLMVVSFLSKYIWGKKMFLWSANKMREEKKV